MASPSAFEQGWEILQEGIDKLKNSLDQFLVDKAKNGEDLFTFPEYIKYYTVVYNMCTEKFPHDFASMLYAKYEEVFQQYLTSTVLPSLEWNHGEVLLREFVRRWAYNKIMTNWLARFFHYLDRYYVAQRALPTLHEVGLISFRELVFENVKAEVTNAVISQIGLERQGGQIDQALLRNVIYIFMEMGKGQTLYYRRDFEKAMLNDTASYYTLKASEWSSGHYMLKAEECWHQEKDRVVRYLHPSSEENLLKVLEKTVSDVHASQSLENGIQGLTL